MSPTKYQVWKRATGEVANSVTCSLQSHDDLRGTYNTHIKVSCSSMLLKPKIGESEDMRIPYKITGNRN